MSFAEMDTKEKQKQASKLYREKQKEMEEGLQQNLDLLQNENKRLQAENNLLREQTNGIFRELNETIRDLTVEVEKMSVMPQDPGFIPLKDEYSIINQEPFSFNENALFVVVLFLIVVLPAIFFPQISPVTQARPQFMSYEEAFRSDDVASSGIQIKPTGTVGEDASGQVEIAYEGQVFKIEDFCDSFCNGNVE